MIIYALIRNFNDLEEGTKLVFNKSLQRFETLDHEKCITNEQSAKNPGMIVEYKIVERVITNHRVFVIPF